SDEVLAASAQILAEGLEQDVRPDLQQRYCDTLARMGPYAVPALEETVKQPRSLRQQQAAISVLKQMGPAARKAAPTLEWLAGNGSASVRGEAEQAARCIRAPGDGGARVHQRPCRWGRSQRRWQRPRGTVAPAPQRAHPDALPQASLPLRRRDGRLAARRSHADCPGCPGPEAGPGAQPVGRATP